MTIDKVILECAAEARDRLSFWTLLARRLDVTSACEIGVFRGKFAAYFLDNVESISRYYMIDPWRNLEKWEKPANKSDDAFEIIYKSAMQATKRHLEVLSVLRGTTSEMISKIKDDELDFLYIDGDHTLRGISIDLISSFQKVRTGGIIAGDDFVSNIFQHGQKFEPTLVFPYAVYFAEAVGCPIFGLPNSQFLIVKDKKLGFEFFDLTNKYNEINLNSQLWKRNRKTQRNVSKNKSRNNWRMLLSSSLIRVANKLQK